MASTRLILSFHFGIHWPTRRWGPPRFSTTETILIPRTCPALSSAVALLDALISETGGAQINDLILVGKGGATVSLSALEGMDVESWRKAVHQAKEMHVYMIPKVSAWNAPEEGKADALCCELESGGAKKKLQTEEEFRKACEELCRDWGRALAIN